MSARRLPCSLISVCSVFSLALFASAGCSRPGRAVSPGEEAGILGSRCATEGGRCYQAVLVRKKGLWAHQAVAGYKSDCAEGDVIACSHLAALEAAGVDVARDYPYALRFFQDSCDTGSANACSNLGVMVANGLGVPVDDARAVHLFDAACRGGDAGGCSNLGVMYDAGLGVDRDTRTAAALYRDACDAGVASACSNLGSLYENGAGVPRDLARAEALYEAACHEGTSVACPAAERISERDPPVGVETHRVMSLRGLDILTVR